MVWFKSFSAVRDCRERVEDRVENCNVYTNLLGSDESNFSSCLIQYVLVFPIVRNVDEAAGEVRVI